MTVQVFAEGISQFQDLLERIPEVATRAARLAINDVARGEGRKALVRQMLDEVNFPPGYLNEERLAFRPATEATLEAVITGRQRPTSLARFASGGSIGGQGQTITARVKKGSGGNRLPGAFLVRLRSGRGLTEDNFNVGLAMRVPKGQAVTGRKKAQPEIFPDVFLLYGPSVDQVFRTAAADQAENISRMVSIEFFRQFDRLIEDGGP